MSSATCANEVNTSNVATIVAVFCNLVIFFDISSLIFVKILYSNTTTFSSAPNI